MARKSKRLEEDYDSEAFRAASERSLPHAMASAKAVMEMFAKRKPVAPEDRTPLQKRMQSAEPPKVKGPAR